MLDPNAICNAKVSLWINGEKTVKSSQSCHLTIFPQKRSIFSRKAASISDPDPG